MADFSSIIQEINTNLPDNTEQLITPEILRNTLINFVNKVEDSDGDLETVIQSKQDTLAFDNTPTENSDNPVTSSGVYNALQGKEDTLTFDNTPTENSDNPVTSDGVYDALQEKADKVVNATSGNFASFDNNGNLIDSGYNEDSFTGAINITYADLKALRDGGNLVTGTWYRITDYACTTTQQDTQSANHAFDIIVCADDASHLNENARAAHHEGDTYFANCKLEAWELKYCLDNDINRFVWADEENGKGVIFYMKDEYENIAPFDFKNILFTRDSDWFGDHETWAEDVLGEVPETDLHFYFLSWVTEDGEVQDASIVGQTLASDVGAYSGVSNNEIKGTTAYDMGITDDATSTVFALPCTIIVSSYAYDGGIFYGCYGNSFGNDCYYNSFGNNCRKNSFENSCQSNTFGNNFGGNTFGNYFQYNTFRNEFYDNSFGNGCKNNTFGNGCTGNSFGNYCYYNTFGNDCKYNIFGNEFYGNSLGDGCYYNTFENYCKYNTFGDYCQTITVFDGVQNCNVTGGTQSIPVKNAQILNGTAGASVQNKLTIAFAASKNYTQVAGLVNGTTLRIWIVEDTVTGPTTATNNHIALFDGATGKVIKDSGVSISGLSTDLVTSITYDELVTLKSGGNLVPGMKYRITDYTCTTVQANTQSAGHVFDIIVTADSETKLNENAKAAHHEGDEYFTNCKLEAWELKYCIDNDNTRFAWASNAQIYNSSNIERIKVPYDELLNELKSLIVSEGLDYSDDDCAFYFHELTPHSNRIEYCFSHDGGASLDLDFGVFLNENTEYFIGNTVVMESRSGQGDPINVTLSEINNDTNVTGKGVIYYMKDEWNNECPYDFKNIMFKRWAVSEVTNQNITQDALEALNEIFVFDGDETKFQARFGYKGNDCTYGSTVHVVDPNDTGWYYTFSVIVNDVESGEYSLNDIEDGSIKGNNYYNDEGCGGFYGNTIKPRYNNMASYEDGIDGAQVLNNIVLNGYYENSDENPYIYGCNNNSFGGNCYYNTFGNGCYWNSFGNNCYYNSFGNNCKSNSFGDNCYYNTFGNGCSRNTFRNNCYYNSFVNYCQNNSFGNSCNGNSFGNGCTGNSFWNDCAWNSFGNDCNSNSFGNYCGGNSFGNSCYGNSFGNYCYYNSFGNYCQNITVFDNVQNCSVTGGNQNAPIKNTQIINGTKGVSPQSKLTITFAANKDYTQVAGLVNGTDLRIWIAEDTVTGPTTATNNHIALFDGATGKVIKDSGVSISGLSTDLVTSITYSELVDLKTEGNLVPGMKYRITDYTCTTIQANTQSAGHVFDIIVTADSETELNENAKAAHHNGDTYFANCNLETWELKYCLENDTNRFAWAMGVYTSPDTHQPMLQTNDGMDKWIWVRYPSLDSSGKFAWVQDRYSNDASFNVYVENSESLDTTQVILTDTETPEIGADLLVNNQNQTKLINGTYANKGVIYYMKDEYDNIAYFDFKNILITRTTEWFRENEDFLNAIWGDEFEIPEKDMFLYFLSWIDGNGDVHDLSTISENHFENGKDAFGNEIKYIQPQQATDIHKLSIPETIIITSYIYTAEGAVTCSNNKFGCDCNYNTIFESSSNTFDDNCSNNMVCGSHNIFGSLCSGNKIIGEQNTFGCDCGRNTINGTWNMLGTSCTDNTISGTNNSLVNEIIGVNFKGTRNIFVGMCRGIYINNVFIYDCKFLGKIDYLIVEGTGGSTSSDGLEHGVKNAVILGGMSSIYGGRTITFEKDIDRPQVACIDSNGQVVIYYADEIVNKTDKVQNAVSGNFAGLDSNGNLTDSGYSSADFVSHSDLSNTPKIVIPSVDGTIQNMTNDEIASLKIGDIVINGNWVNYYVVKKSGNANGSEILLTYVDNINIGVISLKKTNGVWAYNRYWSIALTNINISGKADKVQNAVSGNLAGLDSTGNLTDSGVSSANISLQSSTPKIYSYQYIDQLTSEQVVALKVGDIVLADHSNSSYGGTTRAYYVTFKNDAECSIDTQFNGENYQVGYAFSENIWTYVGTEIINLSDYLIKIDSPVAGDFVAVSSTGYVYDSGKKTNDFATAAQGAKADTAYQKPSTGIPVSDLASGVIPDVSGFITNSVDNLVNYYLKSETYSQAEVNALIGAIQQFHYEIYQTLPATGASNVLYLIGPTGTGSDMYEEYVYANNVFTKIGDTSIDLSGYVTTTALNTALADYTTTTNLNTLLAGKQDTISDLATIRSGAALGATAYQKPSTGIPASDLASGVIPAVPVQDVTVGGTSIVSNGTAVIPQEVFIAQYNVTTYSDIITEYNNGKLVICLYQNHLYTLTNVTNNYAGFSAYYDKLAYLINVTNSNVWSEETNSLQSTYDRVSTIIGNEASTALYPNTKAVADYVVNKADKTLVVTLTGTSVTQELVDNTIYQCSTLSSLTIRIPNEVTPDYISQINFSSRNTATTLTAPNTIAWFGDDIVNDVFVPVKGKLYVVMFYSDGVNVRGVVQCLITNKNVPGGGSD